MKNYSMLKICVWVIYPIVFITGISLVLINYISDGIREDDCLFVADNIPPKEEKKFTLPTIRDELITHLQRADYMITCYWDHFDFNDTTYIDIPEITEQAFVDFIDIFSIVGEEKAIDAIGRLFKHAEIEESEKMYKYFIDLAEKYLYDVNSPFLNEDLYASVINYILQNKRRGDMEKARQVFQLNEINKNRRGTIATDFIYTLINGDKDKLHSIKAEYTLLFFYYSDCMDCKRTKKILENSQIINSLLRTGELKILALYPGSDIEMWRAYSTTIPQQWINAYDSSEDQIIKNKLYSIRAIPSLYLLDRDKRVVMKDVTAEQVFAFLNGETYK